METNLDSKFIRTMDSEIKAIKKALEARQNELRRLINQMKADELYKGSLYKNLESELQHIQKKLEDPRK